MKLLEYRGYDSAGIAYFNSNQIQVKKVLGKVNALDHEVNSISSHVAMSHTRWATHGKPSESNAHPHVSHETIAIVHNGIIDNYQNIKTFLISEGYSFSSETDTEVIAHLLHFHSLSNDSWMEAIRMTCSKLEGSYALSIFNSKHQDQLIGVSMHSPLVIGVSQRGYFMASDMLALSPHTRFYLPDRGYTVITSSSCEIFDKTINKKPLNFIRSLLLSTL